MATSHYTDKCMEFHMHFQRMESVTTFETEDVEFDDFSGSVCINNLEFVSVNKLKEGVYMVYINNPDCEVDELGCPIFTEEHPQQQWIFGYYKSFKRALNKAKEIVEKRAYPKPIEIW